MLIGDDDRGRQAGTGPPLSCAPRGRTLHPPQIILAGDDRPSSFGSHPHGRHVVGDNRQVASRLHSACLVCPATSSKSSLSSPDRTGFQAQPLRARAGLSLTRCCCNRCKVQIFCHSSRRGGYVITNQPRPVIHATAGHRELHPARL